jgi:hypothetical protein
MVVSRFVRMRVILNQLEIGSVEIKGQIQSNGLSRLQKKKAPENSALLGLR